MNSKVLSTVTNVVLVLCALAVTGLLVRRELFTPRTASADVLKKVDHWTELAAGGHTLGPADAPVRILEFADFQCPYCAALEPDLDSLRSRYPGQVAVIYRHFPIPSHRYAVSAAQASECAAAQGRFDTFHDALFAAQDSIGHYAWRRFAQIAGVPDRRAFDICVGAHTFQDRVSQDAAAAHSIGALGTPTLVVNGVMLTGSSAQLDSVVEVAVRAFRNR